MSALGASNPGISLVPVPLLQDRYRLLGLAGESRLGPLYKGEDTADGTSVAVRMLPLPRSQLFSRGRFLELEMEACTRARRVDHPQAVPVYDVATASVDDVTRVFVVSKWIEAQTLQSLLNHDTRVDPARASRYVRSLADAIQAAHAAGVVHWALDPTNIFIPDDELPLIADFGVSLCILQDLRQAGMLRNPVDVRYVAPEIVRLGDGDARCDVYSLGRIAKVMIAGDGRVPARRIPDNIRQAIVQATQADPSDRPETMLHFVEAMGPMVGIALSEEDQDLETADATIPHTVAAVVEAPKPVAAVPAKRKPAVFIALLILLVLAVGILFLTEWGSDEVGTNTQAVPVETAHAPVEVAPPPVVVTAPPVEAPVEPAPVETVEPAPKPPAKKSGSKPKGDILLSR